MKDTASNLQTAVKFIITYGEAVCQDGFFMLLI